MMLDALNEDGRAGSRNEFRGRVPLILGASLGLIMAVNSTLVYSMGVFIAEIERQFGWHRSDISLCYTIFTGVLFLGSGLAGRVADRVSPAQLIGLSMLAYGAMLVVMPLVVHSVQSLWLAYALVSLLGLGATQVVLLKPVSGAFQRQRGMAIGLSLAGGGIGAVVIPLITAILVKQGGWAWGYRGLGLIVLAVAPVVWLLLRSRSSAPAPSRAGAIHEGRTIGEARQSRQFWALLLISFLASVGASGVITHLVPLQRDLGVSAVAAASYVSLLGAAALGGRLATGAMLDLIDHPWIGMVFLVLGAAGAVLLSLGGSGLVVIAVILLGLALGSEIDLISYYTGRFFGMREFGAIFGWNYAFVCLGSACGPLMLGLLRDAYGNYSAGLLIVAGVLGCAAILCPLLGRYHVPRHSLH